MNLPTNSMLENRQQGVDSGEKFLRDIENEIIQLKLDIANFCTFTEQDRHQAVILRNEIKEVESTDSRLEIHINRNTLKDMNVELVTLSDLEQRHKNLIIFKSELKMFVEQSLVRETSMKTN